MVRLHRNRSAGCSTLPPEVHPGPGVLRYPTARLIAPRGCPVPGMPVGLSGLPSCSQHEVVPDPARLERAATLTDCGLGLALTG